MEPRNIAAIEISSSKIKGGVAQVDENGTLTVLAVEEIKASDNVRYGRVQNVQEVSSDVNELIRKLENNPAVAPKKIVGVVVPVGGRSLGSIPAFATLHFPAELQVVAETVNRLKQEALKDILTNKSIEAVVPRKYFVNNIETAKPIGNYAQSLRGEFVLIAISPETRRNLDRVKFETIPVDNIYPRLRATAVADLVLTDAERQLGCALVDFGAETTTISVYKDGSLAYLATLPMGSRLITRDLMSGLSLTEDRAEEFKTSIGNAAIPSVGVSAGDANTVEVNNYVQARAGEIAANIVHQILQANYKAPELAAGIILTGGGAHLRNFDNVLEAQSKMKVRMASIPPVVEFRSNFDRTPDNIDIVSLLWAGARSPKVVNCLYTPPGATIVFTDEPREPEETHHTTPEADAFAEADNEPDASDERYDYRDTPEISDRDEEIHHQGSVFGRIFGRKKQKSAQQNAYDDGNYDDEDASDDVLKDQPDTDERSVNPSVQQVIEDDEPEHVAPQPSVPDPFGDEPKTPARKPLGGWGQRLKDMTEKLGEYMRMPDENEADD